MAKLQAAKMKLKRPRAAARRWPAKDYLALISSTEAEIALLEKELAGEIYRATFSI